MSNLNKLKIQFRHGTLDEWNQSKDIPFANEILLVKEMHKEMEPLFKLGDGIHIFKDLPYVPWDYAFRNGIIYIRNFSSIKEVHINLDA